MQPAQFLQTLGEALVPSEEVFRLGVVTSTAPTVRWDGEQVASTKTYPTLSSYSPVVDDRVLAARVGHTWVVLGAVS